MTRAYDALAFEGALIERPSVVRAEVLNGKNVTAHIAEQNFNGIHDYAPSRTRRNLR